MRAGASRQRKSSHLVRDGAVLVDGLEDPGLGQGGVPLADLVGVRDGLNQQLGRHLNLGLASVNLPASGILTTLHQIALKNRG